MRARSGLVAGVEVWRWQVGRLAGPANESSVRPPRSHTSETTLALPAPPAPWAFRLGLGPVERRADLAEELPAVALLGAEEALGPSVQALRVAVVVRLSGYVPGLSFGHALTVAKSQQSGREPEAEVTGSRHPRR